MSYTFDNERPIYLQIYDYVIRYIQINNLVNT